MSRNLAQIAADLLARPMEGRELSDQLQRLGLEIRLVVQSEDTVSGRFRDILESLRTIVSDEKQRYQAALQALSLTLKLGRQDLLKAMNAQLEEIKIVEAGLLSPQSGWRYGQNGMDARAEQLKGELGRLRGRLAQAEAEEKAVAARIASRKSDLLFAEKTEQDLFADLATEIRSIQMKLEALTTEAAPVAQPAQPAVQPAGPAARPVPPAGRPSSGKEPRKIDAPGKKKEGAQRAGSRAAPPQQDMKFQRRCPLCGGPFNLLSLDGKWQCFTCAHEEPVTEAVPATGGHPSGQTAGKRERAAEVPSPSGGPAAAVKGAAGPKKAGGARKKACPVCFKKLTWNPGEKVWRCPAGHHETR